MVRVSRIAVTLAFGIAASATNTATASDGVLEINQSCALVGCFSGDSAGFPVTPSASGSFKLTSNLVVPSANTNGIQLAPRSTLDLNGFEISGPTICAGGPVVCSGTGSGIGVLGEGSTTIRNGAIRGMGSVGVSGDGRFENLLIESNGSIGISVSGSGAQIENCRILQNGGIGILVSAGANGAQIQNCRIVQNGGIGINVSGGSPRGVLIGHNTIVSNGGAGVLGSGLALFDNAIDNNGGFGLNANVGTGQASYGGNAFYNNNGANTNDQVSGGQSLGGNWCGDAAC